MLRMGDRVTVVGHADSIEQVVRLLGNEVRSLEEPNMVTISWASCSVCCSEASPSAWD